MEDELSAKANVSAENLVPRPPRARFIRHSRFACRLQEGRDGPIVSYVASSLLAAVVLAGHTDALIDALACAWRLAMDEGFDAGKNDIQAGIRQLLGLRPVATLTEPVPS